MYVHSTIMLLIVQTVKKKKNLMQVISLYIF